MSSKAHAQFKLPGHQAKGATPVPEADGEEPYKRDAMTTLENCSASACSVGPSGVALEVAVVSARRLLQAPSGHRIFSFVMSKSTEYCACEIEKQSNLPCGNSTNTRGLHSTHLIM